MTSTTTAAPVDADAALKQKHRTMWASGHYDRVADEIIPVLGERVVASLGITSGERVLDIAAGNGNASVPAARAGAQVVASDLTPELLEIGRAQHADLDIEWAVADAEALPWPDASYDVVVSTVGVMFAPHHQAAADELVRVLRPGGRFGLVAWTPEGFIGRVFATMKEFVPPPPAGVQPPPLWGSEAHVRELLGDRVEDLVLEKAYVDVDAFAGPADFRTYFRENYGPTLMAYRGLADQPERTAELDAALDDLAAGFRDESGRMRWEYVLVSGRRR
ncbi:SAM-dependent methyltransferase [Nocardioides sp. BE266]|uniref:class I SAM-dependent methyltransferase n=1 Tax=Nocardioides sp. BE266 TaxID=2817725 RepID=UPI0028667866|nr:class I SAM-dependent methyltransferase [Nocardioides sp. BE266]MDR7251075.1 SAM-dependent methyltransferase [Nocardioides sp. BE266]